MSRRASKRLRAKTPRGALREAFPDAPRRLTKAGRALRKAMKGGSAPRPRPTCNTEFMRELVGRDDVPIADLVGIIEAHYLDHWLKLASEPREGLKTTSVIAAMELSGLASECLRNNNHPMPDRLSEYFARALYAVAIGKPADVAMGVKRRQGVSIDPIDQDWKDSRVAGHVSNLARLLGLTDAAAKELACQAFNLDMRSVELCLAKSREIDTPK